MKECTLDAVRRQGERARLGAEPKSCHEALRLVARAEEARKRYMNAKGRARSVAFRNWAELEDAAFAANRARH